MLFVGISTLIVAMTVTWLVTPGVIGLATWLGALDLPGGRKTHQGPVPRVGGLAVFLGVMAALTFAAYTTGNLLLLPNPGVYWRGLAIAATALFLVGLADDLWGLSFRWKFAAQILASIYVWHAGFRIDLVTDLQGGDFELGLLSLPLTVLWIVGITNAVNLIDGLDGLAAGMALIITGAVATIAFAGGRLGVTAASVALAGSLIGFLRFNFNPARIFLGDSGSLFVGFILAVTSVRGSQKGTTAVAILVPMLILGLPLLDTSLAVTRRIYQLGRRGARTESPPRYVLSNFSQIFLPDRGHIHHRLLDMGLSHRSAVLVLYTVGAMFALTAFAVVLFRAFWLAAALITVLVSLTALYVWLLRSLVARDRPRLQPEPPKEVPATMGTPRPAPTTGSLASSSGPLPGR